MIEHMAEAKLDSGKEFDTLTEILYSTMNFISTSSKAQATSCKAQAGTDWQ